MSNPTNDDFLAQILEAEEKAKKDLEKAIKKQGSDLSVYQQKLEDAQGQNLEKEREKSRDKLKARQVEARANYEKLVTEGTQTTGRMESELMSKLDKQMSMIQNYFVSELIK